MKFGRTVLGVIFVLSCLCYWPMQILYIFLYTNFMKEKAGMVVSTRIHCVHGSSSWLRDGVSPYAFYGAPPLMAYSTDCVDEMTPFPTVTWASCVRSLELDTHDFCRAYQMMDFLCLSKSSGLNRFSTLLLIQNLNKSLQLLLRSHQIPRTILMIIKWMTLFPANRHQKIQYTQHIRHIFMIECVRQEFNCFELHGKVALLR